MTDLVTATTYGVVTKDQCALTDDVETALDDAVADLEAYLKRPLTSGTWRERLPVNKRGYVFPRVPAVTAVISPADGVLEGASVRVGSALQPAWISGGWPCNNEGVTITYTAGYDATSLPVPLRRALCRIAYNALHPVVLDGVPTDARSVRLGDVAIESAGPLQTIDALDLSVRRRLAGWRYRLQAPYGPPELL